MPASWRGCLASQLASELAGLASLLAHVAACIRARVDRGASALAGPAGLPGGLGLAGFGLAWVWLAFLRISARFRFDFWIWLDFGWIWLGFQLDFVLDVVLSLSFNRIFINSRLS